MTSALCTWNKCWLGIEPHPGFQDSALFCHCLFLQLHLLPNSSHSLLRLLFLVPWTFQVFSHLRSLARAHFAWEVFLPTFWRVVLFFSPFKSQHKHHLYTEVLVDHLTPYPPITIYLSIIFIFFTMLSTRQQATGVQRRCVSHSLPSSSVHHAAWLLTDIWVLNEMNDNLSWFSNGCNYPEGCLLTSFYFLDLLLFLIIFPIAFWTSSFLVSVHYPRLPSPALNPWVFIWSIHLHLSVNPLNERQSVGHCRP